MGSPGWIQLKSSTALREPQGPPLFPQPRHWPLPLTPEFSSLPGVYDKPILSARPSPAVSTGGDVTLQCESAFGFDQFALLKKGDTGPYRRPERWYRAHFPIITVTAAHSGTYQCYSFSSATPYLWSAPSDPLELVVTGKEGAEQTFLPQSSWASMQVPRGGTAKCKGFILYVSTQYTVSFSLDTHSKITYTYSN